MSAAGHQALQESAQWSLKDIFWRGKSCKVITQNENGPCSLIALCNILLLRGDVIITPADRPVVSYAYLSELIADYLLTRAPGSPGLEAALSILPRTQYGLDVDVDFSSFRSFHTLQSVRRTAEPDGAGELALFELCGVPLVHGWLPDPADADTFDAVTSAGSYNNATDIVVRGNEAAGGAVVKDRGVGTLASSLSISSLDRGKGVATNSWTPQQTQQIRHALALQNFLDSTSTQLTYHGLFVLAQELEAGHPVALFRNSHVSVLYKRLPNEGTPGQPTSPTLYTLVTDSAFLMEDEIVWESLVDIDGASSEMFDGKLQKATLRQGDYVGRSTADPGYGGQGQPQNEDADYALAMQIYQNDQDRAERHQRRRERQSSGQQRQQRAGFIPPTLDNRTPIEVFTTMRYEPDPGLLLASSHNMTHPDALILTLLPAKLREQHEQQLQSDTATDELHKLSLQAPSTNPFLAQTERNTPLASQHRLYSHVPLLTQHLERLKTSAHAMCAAYPEEWSMSGIEQRKALVHSTILDAIEDALAQEIGNSGAIGEVKGIRVGISQAGRIRVNIRTVLAFPSVVESTELAGRAPLPTVRFDTHPTRVRALNLEAVVANKTDARSLYDVAKYRAGADSGVLSGVRPEDGRCFDVIMWNDEISQGGAQRFMTESSLANVIVEYLPTLLDNKSRFITPRASVGALDGLLRHWIVDHNLIEEADISIDELKPMLDHGMAQLWLCNSLRGVWRVDLVDHLPLPPQQQQAQGSGIAHLHEQQASKKNSRFSRPPQQQSTSAAPTKGKKNKKDCTIM